LTKNEHKPENEEKEEIAPWRVERYKKIRHERVSWEALWYGVWFDEEEDAATQDGG